MVLIAVLFAFLLGCSLTGGVFSFFYHIEYLLMWQIWAGGVLANACGFGISLYLIFRRRKRAEAEPLREELDRFQREFKQALRGHLKVSILFWAHYYKKEKVKSFEDAKREVFQDLKKEFLHLQWMESLLEEIRQELARYK